MKRFLFFLLTALLLPFAKAQSVYQPCTDSTAVPFLRITPDARGGAMGDGGVACADDANALHWNLSNLAFAKKKSAAAISYTPWMRALAPGMNLVYAGFYIKPDSVSAIGISARYFSRARMSYVDVFSNITGSYRPKEFAVDLGYTRKLSAHFSAGITTRFIQSNLARPSIVVYDRVTGRACAGDISVAWKGSAIRAGLQHIAPSLGFSLSNIGTKMWYRDSDSAEFLPANARLGGALTVSMPYHQFTLHTEANRLLVPSLHSVNTTKEKLAQVTLSTGVEYVYLGWFKVRAGYFHEFPAHGNTRYFTTGIGVECRMLQLDCSYLVPVGNVQSPLANTVRFSLLVSFGAFRKT